jgi:hypothetical protein
MYFIRKIDAKELDSVDKLVLKKIDEDYKKY